MDLNVYHLLAHAQAKAGDLIAAYQTRTKLFLAQGDIEGALVQLHSAKSVSKITDAQLNAINAQIESLNAKKH